MSEPGLAHDVAHRLISATRVSGTAVYDIKGERLGHVDDVMIDKQSGRIAYAVLSFGGFLGFNDKHHPLPWNTLRYDVAVGGYVVDLDRDTLQAAPAFDAAPHAARDWDPVDDYYAGGPRSSGELPLDPSAVR